MHAHAVFASVSGNCFAKNRSRNSFTCKWVHMRDAAKHAMQPGCALGILRQQLPILAVGAAQIRLQRTADRRQRHELAPVLPLALLHAAAAQRAASAAAGALHATMLQVCKTGKGLSRMMNEDCEIWHKYMFQAQHA